MSKKNSESLFSTEFLGSDLLASVVVVLVALPLCMGIAIASGVPPALGLVTGVIGGIVVGTLAGSPLQVSGPAAGLAVLVWETVQEHGLPALGVILILAGLMQVAAGAAKMGQWFRAVSPAVVNGMLAGIGVLIFASQFHVMVDDKPRGSGIQNLSSIPEAVWKGIVPLDGSSHHIAAMVGVMTITIMIVWNFAAKKIKMIPAPLVAVVVTTIVANALNMPIKYVEIPASLTSVVRLPGGDSLGLLLDPAIWISALSIAFIASAETLLSAAAVDKMHSGTRTNYDRELLAQGIGNTICGTLGALPMTGVIVRSAANVEAGAKTRRSAILHGGWLLVFILFLPGVLQSVPTACLAAVLVFTGYKLVNPAKIKELAAYGKSEVIIYAGTIIAIVTTNLLEGVLLGMALSVAKLFYIFTHLDADLKVIPNRREAVLTLRGSATFLKIPKLASLLEQVPPESQLLVHFESLDYIDHACLDLLMDWEKQHEATGGSLCIEWEELEAKFHQRRPEWSMTPNQAGLESESTGTDELPAVKSMP